MQESISFFYMFHFSCFFLKQTELLYWVLYEPKTKLQHLKKNIGPPHSFYRPYHAIPNMTGRYHSISLETTPPKIIYYYSPASLPLYITAAYPLFMYASPCPVENNTHLKLKAEDDR